MFSKYISNASTIKCTKGLYAKSPFAKEVSYNSIPFAETKVHGKKPIAPYSLICRRRLFNLITLDGWFADNPMNNRIL